MLFNYKVVDTSGKELKGTLEATNRTNAISLLMNKGYSILEVKGKDAGILSYGLFLKVRTKDILIFSRQLATLFESGVSALRAFNLVAENIPNKYF